LWRNYAGGGDSVSLLERIASLTKAIFTATDELSRQRELLAEIQAEVRAIDDSLRDFRERLVRMEAFQDALKAEVAAEVSRFKAEVERAETKLTRLLPAPGRKRKG
jgi:predicted  nucleic acid-binding Zn-ribbon protein